jgi:hypothetical protein
MTKGHAFVSGEIVTPAKLNALVDDATIDAGEVGATELADDAVTEAKIADGSITTDKLATGSGEALGLVGQVAAWVRFHGGKRASDGAVDTTNTARLMASGNNVASVVRVSVGTYEVTFTTAMADANYGILITPESATSYYIVGAVDNSTGNEPSTTKFRVTCVDLVGGLNNPASPAFCTILVLKAP